jgi:hypothetical protein
MPCVGDVVSEKVLRVPNDTSVESMRRMFFASTAASAAETSGTLARPMRWSIDAMGPEEGLRVATFATVAGAPHAVAANPAAAASAHVTFLNAFTVAFEGESAKLWGPFHAGKRRSNVHPGRALACGRDCTVRFGP